MRRNEAWDRQSGALPVFPLRLVRIIRNGAEMIEVMGKKRDDGKISGLGLSGRFCLVYGVFLRPYRSEGKTRLPVVAASGILFLAGAAFCGRVLSPPFMLLLFRSAIILRSFWEARILFAIFRKRPVLAYNCRLTLPVRLIWPGVVTCPQR